MSNRPKGINSNCINAFISAGCIVLIDMYTVLLRYFETVFMLKSGHDFLTDKVSREIARQNASFTVTPFKESYYVCHRMGLVIKQLFQACL